MTFVRIRRAQANDCAQIAALEQELFPSDAWSLQLVESEILGDFRDYLVVVEHREDDVEQVLGYAGVLTIGTEADVQTIAVAPALRRHQYGRTLMRMLASYAVRRGATQIFLEVREDNDAASALYRSLGFTEIGRRRGYYGPENTDAVVMRLTGQNLRETAALGDADTAKLDDASQIDPPTAAQEKQ